MILVLDVGNTNIHGGLFAGERFLDQWRLTTYGPSTADELGLQLRQFVEAGGFRPGDITAVAVACVVPTLYSLIQGGITRYLGREPFFIEPGRHRTLPIHGYLPAEVGADRLANSVAGIELHGCPLIIVDFGTATTFDVVSAGGEYLGGAIAPGIEISLGALFGKAARLPRVDLVAPPTVIGRTTAESMQSGIIHGYAGLVDNLNRRIRDELKQETRAIATGGLAGIIVPHTSTVTTIEPTLTLQGIRLIWERNRPAG